LVKSFDLNVRAKNNNAIEGTGSAVGVGFGPFTTALQDEVFSSSVHMDADNGQEPYVET
jgi:hypothetical protein